MLIIVQIPDFFVCNFAINTIFWKCADSCKFGVSTFKMIIISNHNQKIEFLNFYIFLYSMLQIIR
jgi:hypothetical protein